MRGLSKWIAVAFAAGLAAGLALGLIAWRDSGESEDAAAAGPTVTTAPVATPTPEGTPTAGLAEWHTYTNAEHGYGIDFPPGWKLLAEPTLCGGDGFCVQNIELTKGDAALFVFVNFQGDPCAASPDTVETQIMVSGYEGTEHRCTESTRGFGPGDAVIRLIPEANGKHNYTLWGQSHGDLSQVDAIVETFRIRN
jgi:hypothetical protein